MSAHREPDVVAEYAKNARMRGLRVIIAGAGISAALPGAVAAHTDLPVIGVPLSGRLTAAGGLDAILSIVQMPPGRAGGVRRASTTRATRRSSPRRSSAPEPVRWCPRGSTDNRAGDRALHPPRARRLWTDEARMESWRQVEVAACEELPGLLGATGRARPSSRRSARRPSPSRRSTSASASPTTTWRRSSTCSRARRARPGAGSTSG